MMPPSDSEASPNRPTLKQRLTRQFIALFVVFGLIASLTTIQAFRMITPELGALKEAELCGEAQAIRSVGALQSTVVTPQLIEAIELCGRQEAALWRALRASSEDLAYLRLFNTANAEIASVYRGSLTFRDLPPAVTLRRDSGSRSITNGADFGKVRQVGLASPGHRGRTYHECAVLLYRDFMGHPFPIAVLTAGFTQAPSSAEEAREIALGCLGQGGALAGVSSEAPGGAILSEDSLMADISDSLMELGSYLGSVKRSVENLGECTIYNQNGMPFLTSRRRTGGPRFEFEPTDNLCGDAELVRSMNVHVRCADSLASMSDSGQPWRMQRTYAVYAPIFNRGARLGTAEFTVIGYPQIFLDLMEAINGVRLGIIALTVGLTSLMIVAGIFFAIHLQRHLASPISRIAQATEEFVLGDYTDPRHRERAEELARASHYTAESEQLSSSYARMVNEIQRTLKDRDDAYQELKATQSKLINSERQALLGTVAAGVAHEVKNALNPVRLRAELMLSALQAKREVDLGQGLTLIIKNVARCTELSNRLNAFARPSDRGSQFDFDLNDAVRDSIEISRDLLVSAGIEIVSELGELPVLRGIPKEITQAIINFLLNSRDAILEAPKADSPPVGHVWISTSARAGAIELKIADDGCGMSEETKKSLFRPFFTTKEAGKGTGLGMGISQNILRAHDADISVESELGKGTTITVVFPAAKPQEA